MADDSAGPGVIRSMVDTVWSAGAPPADPDDPRVRGFAEFGLPSSSSFATGVRLGDLDSWRDSLQVCQNSAFLDGTLLLTVEALLGSAGPDMLTPVTLWELTTFIDALTCFDRLYCLDNPAIDVPLFNRWLGSEVLIAIPDPAEGVLRGLAAEAAADGLANMSYLRANDGADDAVGQEVQALVDGWRAVLGPDFPSDGPFNTTGLDTRLAGLAAPTPSIVILGDGTLLSPEGFLSPEETSLQGSEPSSTPRPDPSQEAYSPPILGAPRDPGPPAYSLPLDDAHNDLSAALVDGEFAVYRRFYLGAEHPQLRILVEATTIPQGAGMPADRPPLLSRQKLAADATYRTYVNQGIANALALPYLPGTLRMPFRRLFVRRASEVQDELVSVALADRIFAQRQPAAPLILPFFTAAVLQQAKRRDDIWAGMARVREQSASFRRKRAELDALLERSQVSADALRLRDAIRDEGLKMADLAGAAQQSASVALGVVAQTGIVPLSGALQVGIDAARGVGRSGSWTRVWRRLFHRHEYFLAQTNSQAIALTNALPQVQQLWEMPKIGGYLDRFASATQHMGHVLRD